jgi:hypothetical protein
MKVSCSPGSNLLCLVKPAGPASSRKLTRERVWLSVLERQIVPQNKYFVYSIAIIISVLYVSDFRQPLKTLHMKSQFNKLTGRACIKKS